MSGQGGEFGLIARYFAPLAKSAPGALGLLDDAALLPTSRQGVVTTADAIVAGVHFLPDDPPETIARKLLRVNLSDIAAKGARAFGYVLTAAFPRDVTPRWLAAFARGLKADQAHFGIHLYGGDTVATPGPATFSVTMFGHPGKAMVRRAGALPGDLVCVTGTIGDGGLGLAELRAPHRGLSPAQRRFLVARYRIPQPRTRFGEALSRFASSGLDVSDGLVQDLTHIADVSGVRLVMRSEDVPLSAAAAALVKADPGLRARLLTAGDDYEIAFTVPKRRLAACKAAALKARTRVTVIGTVEAGQGVAVLGRDGKALALTGGGYDHFRSR
ncbi:MAG: thiamine-phosphate kinase [Alphaproteobacteria bacterium]|nr:thiamine-phosphate kinase [Alphaproteobacteria bacterium]